MADRPRKQHIAPSFYLAEFTHARADDADLWVLDKDRRKQWRSTPRGSAKETDFYTGDFGSGVDAYHVEKALSICEGKWALAIREVVERSALPAPGTESFAHLLTFIAFQAMRGPAAREYIGQLMHEYSKAELLAKLRNESLWQSFVEEVRALGQPVPISREELLDHALSDDYVIDVDKTWKIQQSITAAIKLVPYLAMRHWSLFTPETGAPDYVCSDAPVCVTGADGSTDQEQGFCKPGSVVTIPLGRRHALAGYFEGALDMTLPANEVAGLNTMTMQNARWVYSADQSFAFLSSGGGVGGVGDLLCAVAAKP